MATSLYIHIPFCHSKCNYCSFSSYSGLERAHERYVRALKKELRQLATSIDSRHPLQSVFFGGGTPTILPVESLIEILKESCNLFGCDKHAEISIEANPGTVDQYKLDMLHTGGFNRLSMGVQSFIASELKVLGRRHSPEEALNGVAMARQAGFDNISLDLMYGLPYQTTMSWRQTLEKALDVAPEHLSMYQLTVEDGTPFAEKISCGQLELPDEEEILVMDEENILKCKNAGLEMYEISNFSRPEKQCRHNINYWQNNDYLAVGSGAVSCVAGVRKRRVDDPEEYCRKIEAKKSVVTESEELGREASFRETVIMGLRLTEGVARGRLQERYGLDPEEYYGKTLQTLIAQQLVELSQTHLRITPRGRLFSNIILAELV